MRKILTTVAGLIAFSVMGAACGTAVDTQETKSTTPIATSIVSPDSIRDEVREFKTSRDAVRPKATPKPSVHELHAQHVKVTPKVVKTKFKKVVKPKVKYKHYKKVVHKVTHKVKRNYVSIKKHIAPGGIAACIRKYESGGNYRAQNSGNTASGAYQFMDGTWHAVTGLSGHAKDYPPSVQDAAFYKLWAGGRNAGQWTTAHKCGH